MRRLGVFVAGAAILALCYWFPVNQALLARPVPAAEATVLVSTAMGHGSGVHIGEGRILTAAHVVGDMAEVNVQTSNGWSRDATVLWVDKLRDLALLKIPTSNVVSTAELNCTDPLVGDRVEAIGNPGVLRWMHSFGRISSLFEKRGPWDAAYIVDITVAPGMSGGPLFDHQGRVIGIVVGLAVANLGGYPSAIGFSYVVPASVACQIIK